jgi:hypothetical protein
MTDMLPVPGKHAINAYFHCKNCAPRKPKRATFRDWVRVEIGLTAEGFIQVWCIRCEMEVALLAKKAEVLRE